MDQSPDPNKVKKIREKIWSETGRPELICSIPLDFKMSKSAPASPKRKDKSLFFGHSTSKTKGHDQDEAYHSDSNGTSPPAPNAGAVYKIPKYKGKGKGKGKSSQIFKNKASRSDLDRDHQEDLDQADLNSNRIEKYASEPEENHVSDDDDFVKYPRRKSMPKNPIVKLERLKLGAEVDVCNNKITPIPLWQSSKTPPPATTSKTKEKNDRLIETASPSLSNESDDSKSTKSRKDGERFQCPSCDSNYSRKDHLNAHIKKFHNNEPAKGNGENFQCPSCDGNYSREDNLNAHIKKSHNNAVQKLSYEWFCMNNRLKILKTYPDDVVPSINAINRELNNRWKHLSDSRHGFYEEIAIYQLGKMKTYPQVTLEELKIHHENPHIEGYRFQCPSCDRNYSREDNLKAHIKKSHDN